MISLFGSIYCKPRHRHRRWVHNIARTQLGDYYSLESCNATWLTRFCFLWASTGLIAGFHDGPLQGDIRLHFSKSWLLFQLSAAGPLRVCLGIPWGAQRCSLNVLPTFEWMGGLVFKAINFIVCPFYHTQHANLTRVLPHSINLKLNSLKFSQFNGLCINAWIIWWICRLKQMIWTTIMLNHKPLNKSIHLHVEFIKLKALTSFFCWLMRNRFVTYLLSHLVVLNPWVGSDEWVRSVLLKRKSQFSPSDTHSLISPTHSMHTLLGGLDPPHAKWVMSVLH